MKALDPLRHEDLLEELLLKENEPPRLFNSPCWWCSPTTDVSPPSTVADLVFLPFGDSLRKCLLLSLISLSSNPSLPENGVRYPSVPVVLFFFLLGVFRLLLIGLCDGIFVLLFPVLLKVASPFLSFVCLAPIFGWKVFTLLSRIMIRFWLINCSELFFYLVCVVSKTIELMCWFVAKWTDVVNQGRVSVELPCKSCFSSEGYADVVRRKKTCVSIIISYPSGKPSKNIFKFAVRFFIGLTCFGIFNRHTLLNRTQ